MQVAERWRRVGLAGDHDQPPGDVVEAVPVVPSRLDHLGVLEDADVVAEPQHVLEGRVGPCSPHRRRASALTRSSARAR